MWRALVGLSSAAALAVACAPHGRAPVMDRSLVEGTPDTYQVGRHDTLYSIAWRFNLDYEALASANGIGPPYVIREGQRLSLTEATCPASRALNPSVRDRRTLSGGRMLPAPRPAASKPPAPKPKPRRRRNRSHRRRNRSHRRPNRLHRPPRPFERPLRRREGACPQEGSAGGTEAARGVGDRRGRRLATAGGRTSGAAFRGRVQRLRLSTRPGDPRPRGLRRHRRLLRAGPRRVSPPSDRQGERPLPCRLRPQCRPGLEGGRVRAAGNRRREDRERRTDGRASSTSRSATAESRWTPAS